MNRDLTIVLRTCAKIYALHGITRYIDVDKPQLINVCLSSLVNSINQVKNHTVKLIVIDDHSDDSSKDNFKNILKKCNHPTEFISVEDGTGARHTCYKVYEQVEKNATDLWYHVEDDYLHYPNAIQTLIDSYNKLEEDTGYMIAINPHDDVWRYTRQIYESLILYGSDRHFRTVKHSTYTCLTSKKVYEKYKNHFDDSAEWILRKDENQTINQVWQKDDVMMFSPIPTLAFHVSEIECKDPFLDVDALWNSIPKLWDN